MGRDFGLRLVLLAQPVESVIGNDDTRLLGINGREGEVLWLVSIVIVVVVNGTYSRVAKRAFGNGLE